MTERSLGGTGLRVRAVGLAATGTEAAPVLAAANLLRRVDGGIVSR